MNEKIQQKEAEREEDGPSVKKTTKKGRRILHTERSKVYHRKKLLVKEPDLLKVQDALEHVIVVGSQVRREHLRRKVHDNHPGQRLHQPLLVPAAENNLDSMANDVDATETNVATTTMTTAPPNSENTTATPAAISLPTRKPSGSKKRSIMEHAGDIRIYGQQSVKLNDRGYYPMKTWPRNPDIRDNLNKTAKGVQNATKRTKHDNLDSEWNYEYGDSIPPVLFRLARLSAEFPMPKQKQQMLEDVPPQNKTLQSTDVSVPLEHVPRAILERCWERAVHMASNTMAVVATKETDLNDDIDLSSQGETPATTESTAGDEHQRPASEKQTRQQPHTLLPAHQQEQQPTVMVYRHEQKCRSLGIALVTPNLTECPRCTRTFQAPSDLKQHYYGKLVSMNGDSNDEDAKEFACCLPLVRTGVLETMDELLQNHVQWQTDQILNIVLSGAVAGHKQNGDSQREQDSHHNPNHEREMTKYKQWLGWEEVLSYLEHAAATGTNTTGSQEHPKVRNLPNPSPVIAAQHPILETMRLNCKNGTNPLVLNQMVVENVRRRLLARYTPAPF